jgi:hypothetical protein
MRKGQLLLLSHKVFVVGLSSLDLALEVNELFVWFKNYLLKESVRYRTVTEF